MNNAPNALPSDAIEEGIISLVTQIDQLGALVVDTGNPLKASDQAILKSLNLFRVTLQTHYRQRTGNGLDSALAMRRLEAIFATRQA